MAISSRIAIEGEVIVTAFANLRLADASRAASVARKLQPGTRLPVHAMVIGEAVQGNAHWFETDQNCFVWAGACDALIPTGVAGGAGGGAVPSPTGRAVPIVVDLSHHNRVTSFTQAFNSGVRGIIHKATTGSGGRDDAYHDRRQPALAAGLLWGAYHWGTAAPAKAQVKNFLEWSKPDDDTLVALDFERDPNSQMTLQGAREFLEEIQQKLGRRAVLYSGETAKGALGNRHDEFFGGHRLWLPQYGQTARLQTSWPAYWMWQYTDGTGNNPMPRSAPGIPGNSAGAIDCNHFAGTEEELREQWAS